jgi:TonB family protein
MTRMLICILAALVLGAFAQDIPQSDSSGPKVVVSKLSPPVYPPLALQARINGAVTLDVAVGRNGSVQSVTVVSGHPILTKAAVESAQQTQFACTDCSEGLTHRLMTYRFELGETIYCSGIDANGNALYETHPGQVNQTPDGVTIVEQPVANCDPAAFSIIKVRSLKCLFLWRCSKRYPA